MFVIGLIIGLIIGILLGIVGKFIYHKIKNRNNRENKYIKRGIYSSEYEYTVGTKKTDFTASAEVGVIERTKNKSKIEIISLKTTIKLPEEKIKFLTDLIEGWVDSDKIEFLEPHPSDIRDEKLDGLLD